MAEALMQRVHKKSTTNDIINKFITICSRTPKHNRKLIESGQAFASRITILHFKVPNEVAESSKLNGL